MNLFNQTLSKKLISPHLLIMTLCCSMIILSSMMLPSPAWAQDGAISAIPFAEDDGFDIDDEDWDDYEEVIIEDPYENYNRWMFNVNDKIYRNVFSPLAKGYDFLIPKKIQSSFNNMIRFSSTPKRFFNNLFQKKFKSSFIEFERLVINGTVGIGGFFDPADRFFNLKQQTEDFGQTLGHYNVKPGPYIIWPIVGPSTRRDAIGLIGDQGLSTFFWLSRFDADPEYAFRAVGGVKKVNNYSYNVRKSYDRLTDTAIDPYVALKHAYMQNRESKIAE